jgi:hypothetical protein
MKAEEFLEKKRLLRGYELLLKNPAYAEMLALFKRLRADAFAGLRNRNTSREKRDEYLQAGEDADELLGFVDGRIRTLSAELEMRPDGLEGIEQES